MKVKLGVVFAVLTTFSKKKDSVDKEEEVPAIARDGISTVRD